MLQSSRVQPLAMTPALPPPADWLDRDVNALLVLPVDGLDDEAVAGEPILKALSQHGPMPPGQLAQLTGIGGILLEKRLERLAYLQMVVLAGFTPTDALHALGLLDIGNRSASQSAAAILAAAMGMSTESLCRKVVTETESAIETIILSYLGRAVWSGDQAVPFLSHRDNDFFSIRFALKLPLIGIGAAARCFLPGVAQRLGTTVIFPESCEVGNAIGAALIGLDRQ